MVQRIELPLDPKVRLKLKMKLPRLYNLRWERMDDWHFGVYFMHPDNPPESHFLEAIEIGKKEAVERPTRAVAEHGPLPAIWTSLEKAGYVAIFDVADDVVEYNTTEEDE